MQKYCCKDMEFHINEREKLIYYSDAKRYYALNFSRDTIQLIDYCPWCGNLLPKSLMKEWSKTLRNEYAIEDPAFADPQEIPEEFKTDEWWKKRGL